MPRVCILTDSTVQYTTPHFSGHELVSVLPLRIQLGETIYPDSRELTLQKLPILATNGANPRVLPPEPAEMARAFEVLGKEFEHVLVILVATSLHPATTALAYEISSTLHCSAEIHIIDSQSTSVGLGMIVQAAADAARQRWDIASIKRMLHGLIPRIYAIYCSQSLTYLCNSGQLDPGQALVGEMLGITPFFTMENGRLQPIQKARSARHMVDIFHEFVVEFGTLNHIALIQGIPPFAGELRALRERIHEQYPDTPFSEHLLGTGLGAMLGPRSLGLIVMVKP